METKQNITNNELRSFSRKPNPVAARQFVASEPEENWPEGIGRDENGKFNFVHQKDDVVIADFLIENGSYLIYSPEGRIWPVAEKTFESLYTPNDEEPEQIPLDGSSSALVISSNVEDGEIGFSMKLSKDNAFSSSVIAGLYVRLVADFNTFVEEVRNWTDDNPEKVDQVLNEKSVDEVEPPDDDSNSIGEQPSEQDNEDKNEGRVGEEDEEGVSGEAAPSEEPNDPIVEEVPNEDSEDIKGA